MFLEVSSSPEKGNDLMFNEKRIKRKLLLLAIALCIIPVTILYFINEKKFEEASLVELENENNQFANLLDKELAKMRQTVLLLANNPAWEKYYTEPERKDYWKAHQIKAFQYVKEQIPETDEACFLDDMHNGEEVVRVDKAVAHDHELSPSEKEQPFYLAAMQKNKGEVYQSNPYISADSKRWVIGNTTPLVIQEDGPLKDKKVGLIHYEVNLAYLSESLMKNKIEKSSAFVMNAKGDLIASSEDHQFSLISETIAGAASLTDEDFEELQQKTKLPQYDEMTNNAELLNWIHHNEVGSRLIKKDGKKYLMAFHKITIREDMHWVVGTIKPVIKSSIFSLSSILMYATLLAIIFIIIGAWTIINKIFNEISKSHNHLANLAHYDMLTGIPNRELFQQLVNKSIILSKGQARKQFAVLFLDLDRFKTINDTLGHVTGDILLSAVATRLKESIREKDTVSRFGGDEFTILLRDIKTKVEITKVTERILESFQTPFILNNNEYHIRTSIGISVYPQDGITSEELVKNSDLAMYQAKDLGRSNYVFFKKEFNKQSIDRLNMENNIRKALDNDEFEVYYQPKIKFPSEEIVGMEALIRWFHPEIGEISPSEFIPLAEETGLINSIGKWILREACKQNKKWQDEGLQPIVISVNVSASQFQYGNIIQTVSEVLEETELDGKWLELELTESIFLNEADYIIKTLNLLKKMGIKISIDDFGTGYSSLSYLMRFPIDTIKIDRTFIREIISKSEIQAITKAIITMGHSLQCTIVAEGVENERQNTLLKSYQCDQIQGYYYSPPVSITSAALLLKNGQQSISMGHINPVILQIT